LNDQWGNEFGEGRLQGVFRNVFRENELRPGLKDGAVKQVHMNAEAVAQLPLKAETLEKRICRPLFVGLKTRQCFASPACLLERVDLQQACPLLFGESCDRFQLMQILLG